MEYNECVNRHDGCINCIFRRENVNSSKPSHIQNQKSLLLIFNSYANFIISLKERYTGKGGTRNFEKHPLTI